MGGRNVVEGRIELTPVHLRVQTREGVKTSPGGEVKDEGLHIRAVLERKEDAKEEEIETKEERKEEETEEREGKKERKGEGKKGRKEERKEERKKEEKIDEILLYSIKGGFTCRENAQGFPDSLEREKAVSFELPLPDGIPFLSVYQHKAWWTRPFFGKNLSAMPEKTQLVIRSREDLAASGEEETEEKGREETEGREEKRNKRIYEAFLAVTSGELRTDLSGREGALVVNVSPLRENKRRLDSPCLVYGRGEDPYALIAPLYDTAYQGMGKRQRLLEEHKLPAVFEGLGWCTWDSLGQDVSEQAIFDKMEEFRKKQVPISWVLIDDGWSLADREALTLRGLEADPERFPRGLAETVRVLKEKYQVRYVGVWQAMKGYWYGVEEGSKAHRLLSSYLMRYGSGELTVKPTIDASFGFWNTWHRRLSEEGIDFVKIDGQGSVATMLKGDVPLEDAMANLYEGMEASVLLNFQGNMIHCMGMAPENIWNRRGIGLSRSSDDYTPTVEGSLKEHTLQNVYDNVYQGPLYIGDWDMFWSDHEETEFGTLLRVISGGPVYISDGLHRTRKDILGRIIDGKGRVLRCTDIARPSLDCLTRDAWAEGRCLKVYNTLSDVPRHNAVAKTSYVACFSWDKEAKDRLELTQMPGFSYDPQKTYLIYNWH
ncbi:MAG: hypothetical protein IIZ39_06490, partial [Blautia sp.]|nr:hypothetical protein [Blautia sp.]